MCRPLRCIAILVPAVFAIGCSEKADGPPTGPDFHIVLSKLSGCDFSHLGQLANSFLKPPAQQTAKTKVDEMTAAGAYSSTAKNDAFDIMALMEGAVNNGTAGDLSVGSDLVNHLLLCMYNPGTVNGVAISRSDSLSYPASFPDTFVVALTGAHGAFGERSGSSTAPVTSRPSTSPFTGVAPPTVTTTWGSILSAGPTDPPRVVFYGRPATPADPANQTYDWRTIPHNASFNPNIIIGFCVDQATNTTSMVNEQGVAVLAFADAYFLNPGAATCSPDLALLGGSSAFQLAGRFLRFGTGLLTPEPLMAAVLGTGGIGGTSSKCCSKVGPKNVPDVSLSLTDVTTPVKVNSGRFSLTATTTSGTDPVNGTKVTLGTSTNNGTPTSIRVAAPGANCSSGTPPEGITGTGTNPAGAYVFTNLCFTNTGSVFILGTANVEARSDTPVTKLSNKINVKP